MHDQFENSKWNKSPLILRMLALGKPYFVKTPWWLKKVYYKRIWHVGTVKKDIYLTFDDGPHELVTPFVLDILKTYNAKASFFCIGKNVVAHPDLYKRIIGEGHLTGNHTQNHLNGWETGTEDYLRDIAEAATHIDSNLFRPPFGRITSRQAKHINQAMKKEKSRIVMWDILSGDFDHTLSEEECLNNVLKNVVPGSIIVFHETDTAFKHLRYSLSKILELFKERGYQFKSLEENHSSCY